MPKKSKPIYDALLQEAENSCFLDCGCLLSRPYHGTAAITFCWRHKLQKHDHTCPVCSANVHGRVTVALNYLKKGQIAAAETELKILLPLCQPT
jgi:hypothetical protein